jgi:GMP synthase-like glutamine amidotransferase
MNTALVLQHGDWGPPALLGEWAQARGIALDVRRMDLGQELPAPAGQAFVASLGSKYSPADTGVPDVATELEYVERVIDAGIPLLGLCYGGQVLARTLGAAIEAAPAPELGWHAVQTDDPALVAPGPWLQWHYHRFTLPPGARAIARSAAGLQAFTHGPHLGVQFHPESTIEIVQEWARLDGERLSALGIEDGEALVEAGREHAAGARAAALELFDAFWRRAQASREEIHT